MTCVLGWAVSVAVAALLVWLIVYAARRTEDPWWKVWLLGRGLFPTADQLRETDDKKDDR